MSESANHPELTPRQEEVLELIALRRTGKQIAAELGISPSRVDHHVRALKEKLGVNSLGELTEFRLRVALPPPPEFPPSRISKVPTHPSSPPVESPNEASAHLEPRVVPEVLDGKGAGFARVLVLALLVIAILASLVLALASLQGLTELFDRLLPASVT